MSRFRISITLLSLLSILILTIGCKKTLNSEWNDEGIVVDGSNRDWDNHGKIFLEDAGISFGISNDNDSLYFLMQFRDVNTHKMFTRFGTTIWFNVEGKKNKKVGFRYHGEELVPFQINQMKQRQQSEQQRPEMMDQMTRYKNFLNKILVIDKNGKIFETLPTNGPIGPQAACRYSEGIFVYEFAFPLKPELSYSLNVEPDGEVALCLDLPPQMPDMSAMRGPGGGGRGGGGRGGGMGGGRGSGKGGMGGGPGGGPKMNLEPQTMWFSLQLTPEAE